MNDTLQLTGIHHLTAVSANIRENKRFYTETLGLRLVKRTVNQDDTSAYHLFFADGAGSPGTDITFFDWNVAPEQRGRNTITRTALRVRDESNLTYWLERFEQLGVQHAPIAERDGRLYLDFEDSEGQRLALVTDNGDGDPPAAWSRSPIPIEHQIRGLGPITMTIARLENTDLILQKAFHFRPVREYPDPTNPAYQVHVYEMGAGGTHAELHVAVRPDLPFATPGAGGVHHVAFRTPNDAEYNAWDEHLRDLHLRTSGKIDRYYFRSLYYREPSGILFEIATDGPGFAVDENPATLGEELALPPFLEPKRRTIEANLKPIE